MTDGFISELVGMNKKIAPGKGAGNKSEIERKTQR